MVDRLRQLIRYRVILCVQLQLLLQLLLNPFTVSPPRSNFRLDSLWACLAEGRREKERRIVQSRTEVRPTSQSDPRLSSRTIWRHIQLQAAHPCLCLFTRSRARVKGSGTTCLAATCLRLNSLRLVGHATVHVSFVDSLCLRERYVSRSVTKSVVLPKSLRRIV
jgi:hypothetical protein